MHGKNSEVIQFRVADEIYIKLKEFADKKGIKVNEFVKGKTLDWVNRSVTLPHSVTPEPSIINSEKIIKIKQGGRVITYEADAEGNPIYGV